MTFDPNDPRLTAYVLGELDPSERANIEAMLQDSPEGRQATAEIRSTVAFLTERLHEEQAAQSQPTALNHQPIATTWLPQAAPSRPWWRPNRWTLGGLAALLLLGATISLITITPRA